MSPQYSLASVKAWLTRDMSPQARWREIRNKRVRDINISAPLPTNPRHEAADHTSLPLPPPPLLFDYPTIQFMSDLHLEAGDQYPTFDVPHCAPILVLAGDIGHFNQASKYKSFLDRLPHELVLLVPGNHEYYKTSVGSGKATAKQWEVQLSSSDANHSSYGRKFRRDGGFNQNTERPINGRFVFMDRTTITMEDHRMIMMGCTLYSNIKPDAYLTNDFKKTHDWTKTLHNEKHIIEREWLLDELRNIPEDHREWPVVVITHFPPAAGITQDPMHRGNCFESCFCTDIMEDISKASKNRKIVILSGHTHYNFRDERVYEGEGGKTVRIELLSNQRGPSSELKGFDVKMVI